MIAEILFPSDWTKDDVELWLYSKEKIGYGIFTTFRMDGAQGNDGNPIPSMHADYIPGAGLRWIHRLYEKT